MPSSLALAYRRRQALLALNAARAIGRAWGAPADEFVRIAAAIDEGAHTQAVALADAYMAAAVGGTALGIDPSTVGRRVDRAEMWQRPAKHARMAGSTSAGLSYAQQLARSNTFLAARDTWHRWTSSDERITGYRRVLGPGRNCDLCILASSQRYSRSDLHPIHGNCSCSVEPIIGADPGPQDPPPLADPDSALAIREHGELGPTLTDARHDFTGPEDLAA